VSTATVAEIAVARARECPLCGSPAGEPCQPTPAGDHLARHLDAFTAGQLTREYMAAVLGELVVIDRCAVITAETSEQPGITVPFTEPGPCRDYDPNFRLHGCELAAGHSPRTPHRDILGNEWDEHLPDEPWRCTANWGSGYREQQCLIPVGHGGLHLDEHGNRWGEPARVRSALAAARTAAEAEAVLSGMSKDGLLAVAADHGMTASRRDSKEAIRQKIAGQAAGTRDEAAGPSRDELLDALRAVREAIAIPHAATTGDDEKRTEILAARVMHAKITLDGLLAADRPSYADAARDVAYLRERLAECPAEGYKTWDERVAELARERQASPEGPVNGDRR